MKIFFLEKEKVRTGHHINFFLLFGHRLDPRIDKIPLHLLAIASIITPPNLATIVCPARANLSPNIKKHCLHSAFLYFCKILIFSSLVLVFHSLYAAYLRTLAEFIHSFHKFFWKLWTTIRLLLCFLSVFFWIFVFFSVYDLLRPNMSNCLVMPWKVYYAMQKFNLLFLFLIPFLFCRFLCFRDKFVFFCITFLCFFRICIFPWWSKLFSFSSCFSVFCCLCSGQRRGVGKNRTTICSNMHTFIGGTHGIIYFSSCHPCCLLLVCSNTYCI